MKKASSKPGEKKSGERLLEELKGAMKDDALTEALVEYIKNNYGGVGFVLNTLSERPRTFNPYMLKGMSVYKEPVAISSKTAELVAVGASVAIGCDHCLEAHMQRAMAEGASLDEVMDSILVAASIAESSALSVAFRVFKKQAGKLKRK